MSKTPYLLFNKNSTGFLIILLLLNYYSLHAQRCPVPQLIEEREKSNHFLKTDEFENWLQKKVQERALKNIFQSRSSQQLQVEIPVVFHIIHKGEQVGIGTNISKERIDRQLEILNEDFNRLNKDTTETLSQFLPFASNIEIKFIYARQDPEEFETNGIVRILGSKASYSYSNRAILSAESYWPAEDYLNIWVADLSSSLGWAEFPVSNLPGLEDASNNRLIDGVSIDYQFFGENPSSPGFESLGRTLTHEMGHFFGLRHIWGDGGCSVDDYCNDTPESNGESSGCNLNKTTCGSLDMVQNFMDYTDDVCMNLFTLDQKQRMRTVLENSPRRLSLTTSVGLEPPPVFDNDLALVRVNKLYTSSCTSTYAPKVTIRNVGLLPANNYKVVLSVNDVVKETIVFNTELDSAESLEVDFTPINFTPDEKGNFELDYEVFTEEGQPDERIRNNKVIEFVQILDQKSLPYNQVFSSGFGSWQVRNEDGEDTWMILNGHAGIPFFENKQNIGQREQLISPIFDLTELNSPELSFVFSQSADTLPHRFSIYASFNCGESFDQLVYSSNSESMLTAYAVDTAFVPTQRLDWDTIKVDLNYLKDVSSVCFNLVAENRNANNLYLNKFTISESLNAHKEVTPTRWISFNSLYCDEAISGVLEVKNTSRSFVNSFLVEVYEGSTLIYAEEIEEGLYVDQPIRVEIPPLSTGNSNGNLKVVTSLIEEGEKIEKHIFFPFKEDCSVELPPLRLSLRNNERDNWFTFNPDNNSTWIYDKDLDVVSSNSSIIPLQQQEDWLISPLLDVSRVIYLGLIFEIAYNKPYRQSEAFEILLSDENGEVFTTSIYSKEGDSLATAYTNNESEKLVWRNEFIDLSPFVYKEKIRLAFKASHDNGQNIYLRNISFFVGQTPPPAFPAGTREFVVYPNPANDRINLHLNLDNASQGSFTITDLQGNVILDFEEPKILNQFLTFDVSSLAVGMYIIHIQTDNLRSSAKFMVRR
ncbi:hypothetical protein GCM10011506_13790 [Marivirga lumbricoides]|uniref:Peptidase M43 pregnancy-associated plasma-A domain-containing protein n=1 Tax=Marivirga lumbricoides TaxID=1046115 RepID=A0ABQ1LV89_9BACT|nr:hypothetical protein GCM10011506_13790 [Marivirga lumbricoides]